MLARAMMRLPREIRDRFIPRDIKIHGRRNGSVTPGQIRRLMRWLPEVGLDPARRLPEAGIPRHAEVFMEIGFGNGEFLAHLARTYPKAWLVGVEVYLPGVAKAIARLENLGALARTRLSQYPAQHVLADQTPDAFLDAVFILHPDPWPKKRHHKRRLIQPDFAGLLARKLKPGAELWLSTDWPELAEWMRAILNATPELENQARNGGFVPRPTDWPCTKFERRGLAEGRRSLFLHYRRRSGT